MRLARPMFTPRSRVALAAALGLAACAGVESGKTSASAESVAARDSAGAMSRMEGMQGMSGMKNSMGGGGMMERMQTHMRGMDGDSRLVAARPHANARDECIRTSAVQASPPRPRDARDGNASDDDARHEDVTRARWRDRSATPHVLSQRMRRPRLGAL